MLKTKNNTKPSNVNRKRVKVLQGQKSLEQFLVRAKYIFQKIQIYSDLVVTSWTKNELIWRNPGFPTIASGIKLMLLFVQMINNEKNVIKPIFYTRCESLVTNAYKLRSFVV